MSPVIEPERWYPPQQFPLKCPKCGAESQQFQEWRPDLRDAKSYKRRCYNCGWRKTWHAR